MTKKRKRKLMQPIHGVFRTENGSSFPLDMLRYDRCWPSESKDATTIAETLNPEFVNTNGGRPVTLVLTKLRINDEPWSATRWLSFGWEYLGEVGDE